MSQYYFYPSDGAVLPPGAATAANQVIEISLLTSIDGKTPTLGQKPMAGSSPVVIASDQSAIAVTGPLTDAQLRATAVPVSAASLPLPTGAATAANQATEIASLASIDTKLTSPLAVTGPLTDAELRATAVPVSAASLPLPTGAATAANQATEIASLASIDTKLTSPLAVTGPLTDTELRATPVPVSMAAAPLPTGAATSANQTNGTQLTRITDGTDTALVTAAGELNVISAAQPGVDIGDVTVNNAAGAAAVNIQDGGNSITVDGTVGVSGSVAVTGPLTDTELRATPVPVSMATAPLPTGAATAANQTNGTQLTRITDGTDEALVTAAGELNVIATAQPGVDIGDVTVNNAAGAAAVNIQDGGNSITVDGPLTDTQLRATAVPVSMASAPLPTGAATEATLLAFSNKTASAAVSEDFDYQDITYVGATTDIATVVYKTGGAGGTTVATLTMGYDGSNRLTSVTKT